MGRLGGGGRSFDDPGLVGVRGAAWRGAVVLSQARPCSHGTQDSGGDLVAQLPSRWGRAAHLAHLVLVSRALGAPQPGDSPPWAVGEAAGHGSRCVPLGSPRGAQLWVVSQVREKREQLERGGGCRPPALLPPCPTPQPSNTSETWVGRVRGGGGAVGTGTHLFCQAPAGKSPFTEGVPRGPQVAGNICRLCLGTAVPESLGGQRWRQVEASLPLVRGEISPRGVSGNGSSAQRPGPGEGPRTGEQETACHPGFAFIGGVGPAWGLHGDPSPARNQVWGRRGAPVAAPQDGKADAGEGLGRERGGRGRAQAVALGAQGRLATHRTGAPADGRPLRARI